MTVQLRLYRVTEGCMDAFIQTWRSSIVPLRRAFGYRIDGAWVSRDENRFAWVVAYDGPLSWEENEARYYAAPERAALDPDPASFLEEAQTWLMDDVSPDP